MTENPSHQVVVNSKDQYSLWPDGQDIPDGWRAEGFTGDRQDCQDHIETVWSDMRPRSVRLRVEEGDAR